MNYYDKLSKVLKIIRSCKTTEQITSTRRILRNMERRHLPISVFNSSFYHVYGDLLSLKKELNTQLEKIIINNGTN